MLERLNGMFAIVIVDLRNRELLMIRDHLGVKPLYWTVAGSSLLFGSEAKSFLAHPAFKPEVDDRASGRIPRLSLRRRRGVVAQGRRPAAAGALSSGQGRPHHDPPLLVGARPDREGRALGCRGAGSVRSTVARERAVAAAKRRQGRVPAVGRHRLLAGRRAGALALRRRHGNVLGGVRRSEVLRAEVDRHRRSRPRGPRVTPPPSRSRFSSTTSSRPAGTWISPWAIPIPWASGCSRARPASG